MKKKLKYMKKKLKISIKKYENNKLIYEDRTFFELDSISEIIIKFFFFPIVMYASVVRLFLNFVLFLIKTTNKLISILTKRIR